ncbi:YtpI family protein [Paludifilum halophilum]|uniref:YtpI-like protein n=1 Tax=Paludifilum halophilum TaxID=1642702 RepID=A0A235B7Y8_9BACL|nr:YtpI family protein [Paludifilum halophilum]OYD08423.1 hypothetical protein CHM34_06210 [Paludifilum halophilum]
MKVVLILLTAGIIYTAIQTFSHSIKRQRSRGREQQKHQARMNIHMGILFIFIALMQGVHLSGSPIWLFLPLLVAALGVYNLAFGWRFIKHLQREETKS